jgi:hypothetical protein
MRNCDRRHTGRCPPCVLFLHRNLVIPNVDLGWHFHRCVGGIRNIRSGTGRPRPQAGAQAAPAFLNISISLGCPAACRAGGPRSHQVREPKSCKTAWLSSSGRGIDALGRRAVITPAPWNALPRAATRDSRAGTQRGQNRAGSRREPLLEDSQAESREGLAEGEMVAARAGAFVSGRRIVCVRSLLTRFPAAVTQTARINPRWRNRPDASAPAGCVRFST